MLSVVFAALCITFNSLPNASIVHAFSIVTNDASKPNVDGKRQLKTLPSRKHGPFRNLRDSLAYFKDPDRFVEERSKELGPVFQAFTFFRPTVFIGGREAVAEFVTEEITGGSVQKSCLPEIFSELHTEWGALNLAATSTRFQQARQALTQVLSSPEAFAAHGPIIDKFLEKYITDLVSRAKSSDAKPIYIIQELKSLNLQLFSNIFTGKGLTKEQEQLFDDYNSGLLSLTRNSKSYKKGSRALQLLVEEFLKRYKTYATADQNTREDNYVCNTYNQFQKNDPSNWPDERIASSLVLLVWGAYIEVAALCSSVLVMMMNQETERRDFIMKNILEEVNDAKRPFIKGVIRESLRLRPPNSGGFRENENEFEIAGYRIPAKMVVSADPRIGNMDESLFTEHKSFFPERWMEVAPKASTCPVTGTARKLGLGSWFPGGIGAHQCPGMGLAEAIGESFVIKFCEKFSDWRCAGEGLDKQENIKDVLIPIKIPVDEFTLTVTPR